MDLVASAWSAVRPWYCELGSAVGSGVPEVVYTDNLSEATYERMQTRYCALYQRFGYVLSHCCLRSARINQ